MKPPHSFLPLVVAASAAFAGSPAWPGVPSPMNSTVDPCVRVCPAGDMNLHVVVRDISSNPIPGSTVVVDFSSCPGVFLCPPIASAPYAFDPPASVVMVTNGAGVADFPIRAGGTCGGGPVNIYADGVMLAQRPAVSSPDQNGDAAVNAADQGILAARLGGPYDPTADLNCSAALGSGDATVQGAHLGHTCGAVVSAWSRSWGTIKTIYR